MDFSNTVRRCPTCFTVLGLQEWCTDEACLQDAADRSLNDLPVGTRLNDQFRIGRVLGRGGFGITYMAWDERLENRRAIKECFPIGFVRRSADQVTVLPINEERKAQFRSIRDKFLKEARVLAQFHDQQGIVSVLSILDTNGSAYLVMEFLDGRTLKVFLEEQPEGRVAFDAAVRLLRPAMETLSTVHESNWLHRDIAPDNIFITRRGQVKLLDFGAARQAAGQEHSKSLHVVLKMGYAPTEQYSARGQQGPWTDVYALAGTFYTMITGFTPPAALDRLEEDDLKRPSELGIEIPAEAEDALMAGLTVSRQHRTRSVAEFAAGLSAALRSQASEAWPPAPPPPRPPFRTPEPESQPDPEPEPEPAGENEQATKPQWASIVPPQPPIPALPPPKPVIPKLAIAAVIAATIALLVGATASFVLRPKPPDQGRSNATLLIDAVPWATVEQVTDARGVTQTLPEPPATPIALAVPAGEYTVVFTGPPPSRERHEVKATVPDNGSGTAGWNFGEIRVEDYFRRQLANGRGGRGGGGE